MSSVILDGSIPLYPGMGQGQWCRLSVVVVGSAGRWPCFGTWHSLPVVWAGECRAGLGGGGDPGGS